MGIEKEAARKNFTRMIAIATGNAIWDAIGPFIKNRGSWDLAKGEIHDFFSTFEVSSAFHNVAALNYIVENKLPIEGVDNETLRLLQAEATAVWDTFVIKNE